MNIEPEDEEENDDVPFNKDEFISNILRAALVGKKYIGANKKLSRKKRLIFDPYGQIVTDVKASACFSAPAIIVYFGAVHFKFIERSWNTGDFQFTDV